MSPKKQVKKNGKKAKEIDYVKVFNSHPELYTKPFTLEAVLEELWDADISVNLFDAGEVLDDWLEESAEFIPIYNETEKDDYWHHLPSYFEGNEFCVKPTEAEIEAGILYPGHRFIPFISDELHASNTALFDGKSKIATTKVTAPLDQLVLYHSLLGEHGMIEYLVFDDDDNMVNFSPGVMPEFTVTVMDLSDFYRKHNFVDGDMIMMRVDSYSKGELALRYRSSADESAADKGKILKWCALFEDGLAQAISENETDMTIHEEIATALIYHADFLIKNPVINIGGFLALSKKYSLKPLSGGAIFWDNDSEPVVETGFDFDDFEAMIDEELSEPPDTDSLEGILRYMGFDLGVDEVEAYIRDELFHGGNSYQAVMQRCLDDRVAKFPEYEVYTAPLDEHFSLLWDEISASYNRFADGNNGKIRAKALQIKDKQATWMRGLDNSGIDISELPEAFMELAESSRYISEILLFLNQDEQLPPKEYKQLVMTLDAFDTMVETMISDINAGLDS